jgi:hypothetical protein
MNDGNAYASYDMTPVEHIKAAERYADWADSDRINAETDFKIANAILSLAHATIAQAQMQGALRS